MDGQYAEYSDLGISYDVDPIDIFDPHYGSSIGLRGYYQDADYDRQQVGSISRIS